MLDIVDHGDPKTGGDIDSLQFRLGNLAEVCGLGAIDRSLSGSDLSQGSQRSHADISLGDPDLTVRMLGERLDKLSLLGGRCAQGVAVRARLEEDRLAFELSLRRTDLFLADV